MPDTMRLNLPVSVAMMEVITVQVATAGAGFTCQVQLHSNLEPVRTLRGSGTSQVEAIADALQEVSVKPFAVPYATEQFIEPELFDCRAVVIEVLSPENAAVDQSAVDDTMVAMSPTDANPLSGRRAGAGRAASTDLNVAFTIAILRAASNAGLLKRVYRANNQKVLRDWAQQLVSDLDVSSSRSPGQPWERLERESLVLDVLNRVASAAVITAANHPEPATLLQLYDTSAWLFDSQGLRRQAYTSTNLWLAWYPGIENDSLIVDDVIRTMPAAPEIAIPWVVRLFENPSSLLRFRGAVDLEDHDVLHVLLGRGLQDQDEAFVLGFAMGTAKRLSTIETWAFKFVLMRLYPEPYRIPKYLHPSFDLGVECGRKTGIKNLYQRSLKELRGLSLGEARKRLEIDMEIVRDYYRRERERIPLTVASLRLP